MENDLLSGPFLFKERARGQRLEFATLCRNAGVRNVVSTKNPPDIRLHDEPEDWIVALPGRRCYLLAERRLPSNPKERAMAILKRLAYGAHEWASREVILADRRHKRDENAPQEPAEDRDRRRNFADTLPVRRILRRAPNASDQAIANLLNLRVDEVASKRLRMEGG